MPETGILLCCDMDRTVIPNGTSAENPLARPVLTAVAAREEVTLVYVSGRSRQLQLEAIDEWTLPAPAFAIGDVGTTLYEVRDGWQPVEAWHEAIAPDWNGLEGPDVAELLGDMEGLEPQEPEQQDRFKVSFYAADPSDPGPLLHTVGPRLAAEGVRSSLVWSIDEAKGVGLLDVLPEHATKVHAIRFLMDRVGAGEPETVFAGDSGNDIPALTSGLQAVLVRNARDEVRRQALELIAATGAPERLYLAQGGFHGFNGNYAGGVLEGLAHFRPETEAWVQAALRKVT